MGDCLLRQWQLPYPTNQSLCNGQTFPKAPAWHDRSRLLFGSWQPSHFLWLPVSLSHISRCENSFFSPFFLSHLVFAQNLR